MSRTDSDRGTGNSTPAVTSTAEQANEGAELSSTGSFSGAATGGGPPFGDWREQLRDRVREIRARKLVDKRPIERETGGLSTPADAARDEKLQTARQHAATNNDETIAPSPPPGEAAREPDDLTSLMEVLLNPPEGLEPLIGPPANAAAQQDAEEPAEGEGNREPESIDELPVTPTSVAAAHSAQSAPSAQVSGEGTELSGFDDDEESEETLTVDLYDEVPAPPDEDAVPLFQDEARLIDDNPLSEVVETPTEAPRTESVADKQVTPPLDGFRTEMPSWAKLETPDEPALATIQPPPPPDLSAIPNELSEVDIPSWALPRQRDDQAGGAHAPDTPGQLNAEALLAGDPLERAAPAREPRPRTKVEVEAAPDSRPVPSPSASETPPSAAPADHLALRDIHLVGEYSTGTSPAPESSVEDPAEAAQPPAADSTPAPAPTEIQSRPPAAESGTSTTDPTEYDREPDVPAAEWGAGLESDPAPAAETDVEPGVSMSSQADAEYDDGRRFPGLFDAAETPPIPEVGPIEADDPSAEPEPQPVTDTAMEWDLEAPSDPDTILDAQRDPMDPTAPMSDRVFSALADALVLTTIAVILMVGGANVAGTGAVLFVQAAPVPFAAVWLIFGLCYGIFFVGTCGQTLGKMAMRIRVIGSNRFRVGYAKATVRTLTYAATMLPVGLGLVPALKDAEHRALHDRVSGTRVVKA